MSKKHLRAKRRLKGRKNKVDLRSRKTYARGKAPATIERAYHCEYCEGVHVFKVLRDMHLNEIKMHCPHGKLSTMRRIHVSLRRVGKL